MTRLLCIVGLVAACGRSRSVVYSGFIDAPVAAVAAQVSGRLDSLSIHEGQRVKPGQVLARLDARERSALVAQAEANVQHAREMVTEAERNAQAIAPTVRGAEAEIARMQAELDDAAAELERAERLVRSGAGTPQQIDAARARFQQARAAVTSLGANRQASQGRVSASLAAVRTAQAALLASHAALDLARVQLAEADILSPFDGLVAEQNLQPGEWAAPGTPIVTVEDLTRQWVRIDVEETELPGLKLGDAVGVRVIAVPGRTYAAHVIEIGAEGEFALNRDVKRGRPDVRTFRVRVAFDQPAEELRPGMTAEVVRR